MAEFSITICMVANVSLLQVMYGVNMILVVEEDTLTYICGEENSPITRVRFLLQKLSLIHKPLSKSAASMRKIKSSLSENYIPLSDLFSRTFCHNGHMKTVYVVHSKEMQGEAQTPNWYVKVRAILSVVSMITNHCDLI